MNEYIHYFVRGTDGFIIYVKTGFKIQKNRHILRLKTTVKPEPV